jgi:hypothetical protein
MKTRALLIAVVVSLTLLGSLGLAAGPGAAARTAPTQAAFAPLSSSEDAFSWAASEPSGGPCGRGVKPCSASRVGQPCDPKNPDLICSAQVDGRYCCLAYAP